MPPVAVPPTAADVLWNEWTLRADTTAKQYVAVPPRADVVEEIALNFDFGWANNTPRFTLNDKAWHFPKGGPWFQGYHDVPTINLPHGKVVDVVIHNFIVPHPWHIHGYAPYQIASGQGKYPGYAAALKQANLDDPVRRDTFQTPVQITPSFDGLGWSVMRFTTHTPGPWMLRTSLVCC